MKRVAWLTDLHLDFSEEPRIHDLCDRVIQGNPEIVLLGGDVSNSQKLQAHLNLLEAGIRRPIYFVLGNHDFYGSSLASVRGCARELTASSPYLRWLTDRGMVELTDQTVLIGHDCWGDGRLGSGRKSRVRLNDFIFIQELRESRDLFGTLNSLGDEAAAYFEAHLPAALARYRHILVLVHVPPFTDSCWHDGRISNDEWLPHFTCHAAGEVLLRTMRENPDKRMTVLCGHTHGAGVARILPNLEVKTGGARYGSPEVQEVLAVE